MHNCKILHDRTTMCNLPELNTGSIDGNACRKFTGTPFLGIIYIRPVHLEATLRLRLKWTFKSWKYRAVCLSTRAALILTCVPQLYQKHPYPKALPFRTGTNAQWKDIEQNQVTKPPLATHQHKKAALIYTWWVSNYISRPENCLQKTTLSSTKIDPLEEDLVESRSRHRAANLIVESRPVRSRSIKSRSR